MTAVVLLLRTRVLLEIGCQLHSARHLALFNQRREAYNMTLGVPITALVIVVTSFLTLVDSTGTPKRKGTLCFLLSA